MTFCFEFLFLTVNAPCFHHQLRPKPRYLIRETADVYRCVVDPFISSQPASAKLWLKNIIEGKAEMERLIHADAEADPNYGFLLLPDFRWDQKNPQELYCQGMMTLPAPVVLTIGSDGVMPFLVFHLFSAIVRSYDIRSLRDLRAHHLPMLKRIRRECMLALQKRFVQNLL